MTFYFQKIKRETNLTFETRHWVAKSINVFETIFKKKIGRQTKKITPKWHICLLVNGGNWCYFGKKFPDKLQGLGWTLVNELLDSGKRVQVLWSLLTPRWNNHWNECETDAKKNWARVAKLKSSAQSKTKAPQIEPNKCFNWRGRGAPVT